MSQQIDFDPAESGRGETPLSSANVSEIEYELEQAFTSLIPVRDVYEPEILQILARRLPRELAEESQAVLLELTADGTYVVGMDTLTNGVNVKNIARALNVTTGKILPRLVTAGRLKKLQETAYGFMTTAVARAEGEYEEIGEEGTTRETIDWSHFDSGAAAAVEHQEAVDDEAEIGTGTGLRASAERIILVAIKRGASDIHVNPGPLCGLVNYRTDGLVYELIPNVPPTRMENLANAFADMAGVNGYELMQKGLGAEINIVVKTASGKRERMNLRFHGRRSYFGRCVVIRINRPVFRDFHQIGMEPSQIEDIQRALVHRNGVVLVTGATGSGKSNTLEAMLRKLEVMYKYHKHLIQIGNPIEFPNPRRTQLPVDGEESWSDALKDAMRMDPDIFSPGEFRDAEEAAIVFQGASTGHLTLTTLHTNNVAQTFSRLDFLKISRDKQGDLIRLIVSQELVPLLCEFCKKPDPRGLEIAERLVDVVFPNRPHLREAIGRAPGVTPFFHAEGCSACHFTGVRGRTCVSELMPISPDIGRMLRRGVEGEEIVDYAVRNYGMMTLAEAAARKLCRGIISYDHVAHLLITTNKAAPEKETYAWENAFDSSAAGGAGQPEHETSAADPRVTTEPEEYIDAEFSYTPRAAEAA